MASMRRVTRKPPKMLIPAIKTEAAARMITKATEDHAHKGAVHRLTHDIAEDRTRRAHQRTHNDQKVVTKRETNRRRCPTRVAVQHRHNDRHIRAADAHDQVIADK